MDELPEELRGLDPEEVLAFLRTAADDEIAARVHGLGSGRMLDLLFTAWADRVDARPGRVPGLLAFAVDDEGTEHRHALAVTDTGATHVPAPGPARATVSTTLVRFLKVAAGAQDPKWLVLTGRMRLSGDVVWAVSTLAGLQQP